MEFTIEDVLEATGGELVQGAPGPLLTGVSTDSRTVAADELFIAIEGERFDGHDYVGKALAAGAGGAVIAHGPLPEGTHRPVVRVADTARAYGDVASWWANQMPARVVTVTGSNGKTTIKEAVAHLLELLGPTLRSEANHNNHIGVPETLLRLRPEHRFAVVEMGTNHPGEIERLARLV
ncbi:MAG: Mur ligase family protein, partial [bacterium]